jgi:hypothetical protein
MKNTGAAAWLRSWVQQCLLARAPQDDPLSGTALAGAVLAYLSVDVIQARTASGWTVSLAMSITDALIMVLYSWLVLRVAGKPERFAQTLTALSGTGALLGLMGVPLMLQASRVQHSGDPGAALVVGWLMLLIWNITVQAHIFRHALSSRYGIGLLVAGLHTVVAIVLLNQFFPPTAE